MNINTIKYFLAACIMCSYVQIAACENHAEKDLRLNEIRDLVLEVIEKVRQHDTVWKCRASGDDLAFTDYGQSVKEAKDAVLAACKERIKGRPAYCTLIDCVKA